MKIAILSGAYRNAGDHLIVDRSRKLLRAVLPPPLELIELRRNEPLDEAALAQLNGCDLALLAGGPFFRPGIHPDQIPLCGDLARITVPLRALGGGWKGEDDTPLSVYRTSRLDDGTRRLVARLAQDGPLSCRDWFTVRALRANGFANARMTGCPAWYDLANVERGTLREGLRIPPGRIGVSDPNLPASFPQCVEVVRRLRALFPQAEIEVFLHHGDTPSRAAFKRALQQVEGVRVTPLAPAAESFACYNGCDLHVGYRVHAHIYNLSVRNPSLLIEEDGRGAGVNDALGLPRLRARAYQQTAPTEGQRFLHRARAAADHRVFHKTVLSSRENPVLVRELEDALEMLRQTDGHIFEFAFGRQRFYFQVMRAYITSLQEVAP